MTAVSLVPAQPELFRVVGSYLTSVLPDGYSISQGQVNRVAQPRAGDFLVMWMISQMRLSTNNDEYVDGAFLGSIVAKVLTITEVSPGYNGPLVPGHQIFGVDMLPGTVIVLQTGGTPGGVGTYTVNKAQTFPLGVIAAGVSTLGQATQEVMQIDVHGPNSLDCATIISTAFRDARATEFFDLLNPAISPLYADDPRQMPFPNAEQQWEDRWIINANIEVNYTITLPQEFFTSLAVGLINVDVEFPP